jgi:hypothetical protein
MRTRGFGGGGSSDAIDFWVPASAMIPAVTNGAMSNSSTTTTFDRPYDTLDFDAGATNEKAYFYLAMPPGYTGNAFKARVYWTADSGSGTTQWSIAAQSIADGGAIDTGYSAPVIIEDTFQDVERMHISPESSAGSIGSDPLEHEPIAFVISRTSHSDTLAVDARLIAVEIILQ